MKIGNLSKRASVLLAMLLLATCVMTSYGVVVYFLRPLLSTYSTGTVVPSLPANVTINAPLTWGTVMQGQNYTLTRVLTNTGEATDPLGLVIGTTLNQPILSWDAQNKIIPANGTLIVVFTLQVPANATLGTWNDTVQIFEFGSS